ncbi:MAG: molybdopterin molybdotransferase MoeA, partial [Pseudomonadota bacterium]
PTGADTVVPVEEIASADGTATLTAPAGIDPGQFVHRQGTDYASGDALLAPGTPLAAPEVAVLSSVGQGHVRVGGVPRVAVVSTGDELVAAEDPVLPHQIRRANDYAIAAALRQRGVGTPAAVHLRDDPEAMRAAVAELLDATDVLVLSGGVSKGRFDYLPGILDELGVVKAFHRVRQRPGKPMWFGTLGEKLVFALPGNPVSALVCLHRYVLPALALGAGGTPRFGRAVLGADLAFRGDLTRFVPVIVTPDAGGAPVAVPRELNTSGDFFGLAGTQGFVELDGDQGHWRAGTAVPFHPW